jgi:hypothetical protein
MVVGREPQATRAVRPPEWVGGQACAGTYPLSFFLPPQEGLGLAVFAACTSVLVGQVVEAQRFCY